MDVAMAKFWPFSHIWPYLVYYSKTVVLVDYLELKVIATVLIRVNALTQWLVCWFQRQAEYSY